MIPELQSGQAASALSGTILFLAQDRKPSCDSHLGVLAISSNHFGDLMLKKQNSLQGGLELHLTRGRGYISFMVFSFNSL